jgi:hypothetical protein
LQERWNSADIDFFDSNFDEKFAFIDEAVIHANKNIYYRDVHVFVERIKKMIIILESEMIKKNLSSCLRESVLMWHTVELFDVSRRILFYEENVNEWIQTFIVRFKTQITIVIVNLLKERYILTNAKRNRKSREYAQKIIRWAKFAKMTSSFNQLNIVYNDINAEFRRDLKKSFKNTTIDDYLQLRNDCKNIWWFLTRRENVEYFANFSYTANKSSQFNSNIRFYDNCFTFLYQQKYNNWNQQRNQTTQFQNQFSTWRLNISSYQMIQTQLSRNFQKQFSRNFQESYQQQSDSQQIQKTQYNDARNTSKTIMSSSRNNQIKSQQN